MPAVIKYTELWQNAGLLEIDGAKLLLDCGWSHKFDLDEVAPALQRHAAQIDAVILSHSSVSHLGALPVAVARYGLTAPIYATLPVHSMGQMFLYDAYESRAKREPFDVFSLDEVDEAFSETRWTLVKYRQRVDLGGRCKGISISPRPAGHMLGGAVWIITKDTDEIVYAVHFNMFLERHLPAFTGEGLSPSLLITSATSVGLRQQARVARETMLKEHIFKTLQQSGNVLMPVDSAGRILELALILDRAWAKNEQNMRRLGYGLAMLTNFSYDTVNFAQTMTEYMGEEVRRGAEGRDSAPFEFRYVHLCHDLAELERVRSPKVVLTSHSLLDGGFAVDLLQQWAANPSNTILFTQRAPEDSLAGQILAHAPMVVNVRLSAMVPLEGNELTEYYRSENRRRALEQAAQAAQRRRASAFEEEDSSDEEDETARAPAVDALRPGAMKTFPLDEDKRRFDAYGEVINPDDYSLSSTHVTSGALAMVRGPDAMDVDAAPMGAEEEEVEPAIPVKCVEHTVTVHVHCGVHYVDFEGLTDEASVEKLLAKLAPRKLVLVRGSEEQREHLRIACIARNVTRSTEQDADIVVPRLREAVDVSSTRHILQATMTDALVSSLFHTHKDGYELAYVHARITRSREDDTYALDVRHHQTTGGPPPHEACFIGEAMLTEVRQALLREGFEADLAEGVLVCNGEVAVRKGGAGRLTVEGPLGPTYFRVRSLLYQQYAVV